MSKVSSTVLVQFKLLHTLRSEERSRVSIFNRGREMKEEMTYEMFVEIYDGLVHLMLKHAHRPNSRYPEYLGALVDEHPEFEERYDSGEAR